MPRTICPQVKGIYRNNKVDDHYPFQYLFLPDSEYWAIDAYECKTSILTRNVPNHTLPLTLASTFSSNRK